jgi:hypothetical protein
MTLIELWMFFCGECSGREEVESIQAFACEEKGSNSQQQIPVAPEDDQDNEISAVGGADLGFHIEVDVELIAADFDGAKKAAQYWGAPVLRSHPEREATTGAAKFKLRHYLCSRAL